MYTKALAEEYFDWIFNFNVKYIPIKAKVDKLEGEDRLAYLEELSKIVNNSDNWFIKSKDMLNVKKHLIETVDRWKEIWKAEHTKKQAVKPEVRTSCSECNERFNKVYVKDGSGNLLEIYDVAFCMKCGSFRRRSL